MSRPFSRFLVTLTSMESPQQSLEADHDKLYEVLCHSYGINYTPSTATVRIYLQSDVNDVKHERLALWNSVFPHIKEFGDSLGLQVTIIDMYHCLELNSEECSPATVLYSLENEGVFELSLKEVSLCQELSSSEGPAFVTLLGQKYGHKPLQTYIPSHEFILIHTSLEEQSSKQILQTYYKQDTNGIPPVHILQQPALNNLAEWISVHDNLLKATCKGAKIALGKDPAKVQSYTSSVSENEISAGVFNCKTDVNKTCFWFKRVFADLYDQRPGCDTALAEYSDISEGKRGPEFDPECTKLLNYLKEARLSAKYIGLDSTNIFEFQIKWQKGCGLDIEQVEEHGQYISNFCQKVQDVLAQKLIRVALDIGNEMNYAIYQEVLTHTKYCKKLLTGIKELPEVSNQILFYFQDGLLNKSCPFVLHGKSGSGKSTLMASAIRNVQMNKRNVTIMRFIGLTFFSSSIQRLLTSICEQISVVYYCNQKIPVIYSELVCHFKNLLQLPTAEKPLYIFIDGIDLLSFDKGLSWLPLKLNNHVKILLSVSNETKHCCYPVLKSLLKDNDGWFIEISDMSFDDCHDFLVHALSCQNRSLTLEQFSLLSNTLFHLSPTADWLMYVAEYVSSWRSFTDTQTVQDTLPKLQTYKGMLLNLIKMVEEKHGVALVSHTLKYISAAKYGLTENELLDILSQDEEVLHEILSKFSLTKSPLLDIPAIIWSKLLHDLVTQLLVFKVVIGGVYSLQWKTQTLKEIAFEKYFSDNKTRVQVSGTIADYFSGNMKKKLHDNQSQIHSPSLIQTQSQDDVASESNIAPKRNISEQPLQLTANSKLYNARKLSELPFALANAERYKPLIELLCSYHWMIAYVDMNIIDELISNFLYVVPLIPIVKPLHGQILELQLVREALQLSLSTLDENPAQLTAELVGRLLPSLVNNGSEESSRIHQLLVTALEEHSPMLTPVHYYPNVSGGPLSSLSMAGHQGSITSISTALTFNQVQSTHDIVIVSGSVDGTLRSWDCKGSGVVKTFDGHVDQVLCVSVSSNGQYVVSGGKDKTIRFWLVSTAECLHIMKGHTNDVTSVAVTSKGNKAISGSLDCTIKVWNTEQTSNYKGELLFTFINPSLKVKKRSVTSLALSDDDIRLVAGFDNGQVLIIDVISGKTLSCFSVESDKEEPVTSLALAKNENNLWIMAGSNGMLTILNSTGSPHPPVACGNGKLEGNMTVMELDETRHSWFESVSHLLTDSNTSTVAIADSGNLAIVGSHNGTLHIWNLQNKFINKYSNSSITFLTYSPCGNFILSSSHSEDAVKLWSSEDLFEPVGTLNELTSRVSIIYPLSDSVHFVTAHYDGTMKLWKGMSDTALVREFKYHTKQIQSISVTSTEDLLIAGDTDGLVTVWNFQQGRKLRSFDEHSSAIVGVFFYQHEYIVTADKGGLIIVKDFRGGNILYNQIPYKEELSMIQVGRVRYFNAVVTGYENGCIKVWKLQTMDCTNTLTGHTMGVTSVQLIAKSYDVVHYLTTSKDSTIRIWDLVTDTCLSTLVTDGIISSATLNPMAQANILAYTVNGHINIVWYELHDTSHNGEGSKNIILKMLTSPVAEKSPVLSSIINT